jgi:hypothetical protein
VKDYTDEVSAGRIYAGFHYRFSTKVGEDMGIQIGEQAFATLLGPVPSAPEARR